MTPEQEAALIGLVEELAGDYIYEKLHKRIVDMADPAIRADIRREAARLQGMLRALRGGD